MTNTTIAAFAIVEATDGSSDGRHSSVGKNRRGHLSEDGKALTHRHDISNHAITKCKVSGDGYQDIDQGS